MCQLLILRHASHDGIVMARQHLRPPSPQVCKRYGCRLCAGGAVQEGGTHGAWAEGSFFFAEDITQ